MDLVEMATLSSKMVAYMPIVITKEVDHDTPLITSRILLRQRLLPAKRQQLLTTYQMEQEETVTWSSTTVWRLTIARATRSSSEICARPPRLPWWTLDSKRETIHGAPTWAPITTGLRPVHAAWMEKFITNKGHRSRDWANRLLTRQDHGCFLPIEFSQWCPFQRLRIISKLKF